jgi:hypothetical protein
MRGSGGQRSDQRRLGGPLRSLLASMALCSVLACGLLFVSAPALAAPSGTPTVTKVEAYSSPPSGGTRVAIFGTNFTGASAVKFGSSDATSFTVESETLIIAVSPPLTADDAIAEVTVTTPGGTSRVDVGDSFIYEPTVTKVEPDSGDAAGGTSVRIIGTAFVGDFDNGEGEVPAFIKAVRFGSTNASSFKVQSSTEIMAVAPPGAGTVDVTVENFLEAASPDDLSDQFSYGTPLIAGASVTGITKHGAALEARIDPMGHETTYEFWLSYQTCQDVPPERQNNYECQEITESRVAQGHIPAGDSTDTVSADLSDLRPGYHYGYWVIATSSQGKTETTHDASFKALAEGPVISGQSALEVTEHNATLEGQINPEGEWSPETTYVFEYGTTTAYGASTPTPPGVISSVYCEFIEILPCGIYTPQPVSESLAGLEPGTTYHYRIAATNSLGTSYGEDQTFTTTSSRARPLGGEPEPTGDGIQSGASSTGSQGGSSGMPGGKPPGSSGKTVSPKVLTRSQKLAKALKQCEKEPKHKRAECKKRAHKKYAPAKRSSKKK